MLTLASMPMKSFVALDNAVGELNGADGWFRLALHKQLDVTFSSRKTSCLFHATCIEKLLSAKIKPLSPRSALEWRALAMEKQAEPTFLTPRDAAKLLNVPTHRVLKMIQCRALPALRIGRDWRLRKSEVIKWAQQHRET